MTTAKLVLYPQKEKQYIMKDGTNKQRIRILGSSKEKRFRTAIDDIEEAVKTSN